MSDQKFEPSVDMDWLEMTMMWWALMHTITSVLESGPSSMSIYLIMQRHYDWHGWDWKDDDEKTHMKGKQWKRDAV